MALTRTPAPAPKPPAVEVRPLGHLRLTLDDIDDITAHLTREGFEPSIVLGRGTVVAERAEDLKSATSQDLRSLQITVKGEDLAVILRRSDARTEHRSADARAEVAVGGVVSLLRERREPGMLVWFRYVWPMLVTVGVLPLVMVGVLTLMLGGVLIDPQALATPLILILLVGALAGWTNYISRRRPGGTRLLLSFRAERREFTITRRNAWSLGLTTALVSGAVGVVIGWLLNMLTLSSMPVTGN